MKIGQLVQFKYISSPYLGKLNKGTTVTGTVVADSIILVKGKPAFYTVEFIYKGQKLRQTKYIDSLMPLTYKLI